MANLREFTEDIGIGKATDSKLGLVKGGMDAHINENGEIEVINSYGGPFKVSLSGAVATIDSGRIHNGTLPQHIITSIASDSLEITIGTLNAIWIVVNQNGNASFMKTNYITAGPEVTGEGTFFCFLLAVIVYNDSAPYIQQCHFGDIVINGVSY